MNLDAIFRAANENTDPDPSERDFEELMANALRVCLDDLLANRGPLTDEQRKAMFARLGGGGSSPRASKLSGMRALGNRAPSTLLETAVRVARTPSWSVPGYGDPALPMMRTPSKAEPAEVTKMPQVTPEMLERLRKRIAGEK